MILRELTKLKNSSAVILKGGVNLRLFFGSVRYSEDMDLDGALEARDAIRNSIKAIFNDREFLRAAQHAGIRGLDAGQGPNKDTETTFRNKFGVVLQGGVRYPTKVEVSFRARHVEDESVIEDVPPRLVAGYGMTRIAVNHYSRTAALRQKIEALGGRAAVQARDVFDLHTLAADGVEESLVTMLAARVDPTRLQDAYTRALTITFEEYEGQVLEFLADDARARHGSEEAWDELRLQAATLIEAVLKRTEGS
ncbi:MAG TPA: nucleotidyl transferase AbiEii/AbiGii toxin family protein [Longimicrobiales bacterium]|nr:nucleotidyl transferase AbiEii/AbiGii toxin family protein [Longimicrobiales bacterium]